MGLRGQRVGETEVGGANRAEGRGEEVSGANRAE